MQWRCRCSWLCGRLGVTSARWHLATARENRPPFRRRFLSWRIRGCAVVFGTGLGHVALDLSRHDLASSQQCHRCRVDARLEREAPVVSCRASVSRVFAWCHRRFRSIPGLNVKRRSHHHRVSVSHVFVWCRRRFGAGLGCAALSLLRRASAPSRQHPCRWLASVCSWWWTMGLKMMNTKVAAGMTRTWRCRW